jgi:hypothetical protein
VKDSYEHGIKLYKAGFERNVGHARGPRPCEERKRGRSLKREPTRAYHARIKTCLIFESCAGKRGAKQPLAVRPRRSVLASCLDRRIYGMSFHGQSVKLEASK